MDEPSAYLRGRIWETKLNLQLPLPGGPEPFLVVEEEQRTPSYRIDGRYRQLPGSQLIITLGGEGALRLNGGEFRLRPGDALLHNYRDPGVCYFYPRHGVRPWRFLWFGFLACEELVGQLNRRYGYLFRAEAERGAAALLAGFRHRGPAAAMSPLAGMKLVADVLAALVGDRETADLASLAQQLIRRAQALVETGLSSGVNGITLARELNVSREHLSRRFHQETGTSLSRYILNRKLDTALHLLADCRFSCKEIAGHAGFRSYSSFVAAVRRAVGKTPNELRRRIGRSDDSGA
jgi:AraC-like DNA-binding protein